MLALAWGWGRPQTYHKLCTVACMSSSSSLQFRTAGAVFTTTMTSKHPQGHAQAFRSPNLLNTNRQLELLGKRQSNRFIDGALDSWHNDSPSKVLRTLALPSYQGRQHQADRVHPALTLADSLRNLSLGEHTGCSAQLPACNFINHSCACVMGPRYVHCYQTLSYGINFVCAADLLCVRRVL